MFKKTSPIDDMHTSALEACTEMMRAGSKSFFAASKVLPKRVRSPATALYAFCRVADDAVDSATDPIAQAIALADLQARLSAIYAGKPHNHIADKALAEVVRDFAIPRVMLEALLEGFAWDANGKQYNTIAELHNYAARVAGTVGAMMTLIMGANSESALSRACELGAAMQLTNIARDVGEDARNGRLYLPIEWMAEAGIDSKTWLANPTFSPALASVISRLLEEADRLYWSAEAGIEELPRDCRMAIHSASLVYAEIGRKLRCQGFDSVSCRAIVSGKRKLALMAMASSKALDFSAFSFGKAVPVIANISTLPAVKYLVDAGVAQAREPASPSISQSPSFYKRTLWVIDVCERIAQEDRDAREARMFQAGSV